MSLSIVSDSERRAGSHTENAAVIDCNEVMILQTTIVLSDRHPPEAGDAQTAVQQAVTGWLKKELYKGRCNKFSARFIQD